MVAPEQCQVVELVLYFNDCGERKHSSIAQCRYSNLVGFLNESIRKTRAPLIIPTRRLKVQGKCSWKQLRILLAGVAVRRVAINQGYCRPGERSARQHPQRGLTKIR